MANILLQITPNIALPKNTQKDAIINVQYIPYLFVIHGDINALITATKNATDVNNANCVLFIFNLFNIVVSNADIDNKQLYDDDHNVEFGILEYLLPTP